MVKAWGAHVHVPVVGSQQREIPVVWLRPLAGVLLLLIGVTWIGQGFDIIKGSGMSGHGVYAVAGAVVAAFGIWLLWGFAQGRSRMGR